MREENRYTIYPNICSLRTTPSEDFEYLPRSYKELSNLVLALVSYGRVYGPKATIADVTESDWKMAQRVKVLILSDNRLLRESLGRILSKRADLEVTSSSGECADPCEEAIRSGAEVLVVDSPRYLSSTKTLPKGQNNSGNSLKILLVAMEEDERLFLRAVRTGVLGFIPKEASALDVVGAVRSVARGEAICPPRLCKFLFDFVAAQTIVFPDSRARLRLGLTRREQQLIPMIGRGLTNKEIANQLNLSEQTIKNHVHRILHKVGVENRLSILGVSNSWDLQN